MAPLSRNTKPLLRMVAGKEHATADDHVKDGQSYSSDDDDDNDKTSLGTLRRRKGNVRAPARTFNKSPAKREAVSSDEEIFAASQSSQSNLSGKKIKTFSRKHGSQNAKPLSQQKPASQFKEPQSAPTANRAPEPRKKAFRALPSTDLESSQPDAPSSHHPPSFFHPPAVDSTELSAQSQPIYLESSQLSPPPSSPLSSLHDSEPDLDLDLIGKIVCPICGERVEVEFRDNFQLDVCRGKRMTVRLQEKFCEAHKARNAEQVWHDRGYPKIDWSSLQRRIREHHDHIRAVLEGTFESPFRLQHAKVLSSKTGKSATSALHSGNFSALRTGYYGTRGEKIMAENIIRTFSSDLRKLSTTDKLIVSSGASGGISGYVHAVLVPEMALELIMEDMDCDREKATVILADSTDLGEVCNEDEDEKVPRVEVDLLGTGNALEDRPGGDLRRHSSETVYLD